MKRAAIVVAGASALLLVTGAVGARAADVRTPAPVVQPPAPARAQVVAATTPLDTAVTSTFTPVAACVVADTRHHGGAIKPGRARDFFIGGTTGFHAQGGATSGCGIPQKATAVAVTITVLSGKHAGSLKAFRTGASEPGAAFLYYNASSVTSVASTVGISAAGRARVKNAGGLANVIIAVTGYYMAPLTANVHSDGTLLRGSRATGSFLIGGTTASYEIDFDRDVSACVYQASSYFTGYALTVEPRSGVPNGVYVLTTFGGAATADDFYVTVTC
jgi:hypothetical protein